MDDHQTEQFMRLLAEIHGESDRVSAILAGAGVDYRITTLLSRLFGPDTPQSTSLFRPEDPLGALSSKIEVAFRTGIIDTELHRELHLLRKIRNKFAHLQEPLSFSDSPIRDWVAELCIPSLIQPDTSATQSSHRNRFLFAIVKLMIYLEYLIETRLPFRRRDVELTRDLASVIKKGDKGEQAPGHVR